MKRSVLFEWFLPLGILLVLTVPFWITPLDLILEDFFFDPSGGWIYKDAQPWRFLWCDGALYLYVVRSSWRYRLGGSQDYRFYDGGICMANVSLAMRALGIAGRWELVDGIAAGEPGCAPECPEELQPLAVLWLDG